MTPAAQTNVEFYAMAHFFEKLPLFIKNYPPFKKKIFGSPPEKKLQPLVSALIKKLNFLKK